MSLSWGDKQAMLIMPTDLDPPTGLVRDWVGSALTRVPPFVRMQAALVTAELVDNARWYGFGPYVLHLSLHDARRVLLIAVEDRVPELGAGWSDRAGLVLVAALSERWGVEHGVETKTVWAELSIVMSGTDTAGDTPPSVRGEP